MNGLSYLKLALLMSLCAAHQAFAWHFGVTNWSNSVQDVEARYPGCSSNRVTIGIESRADFNAEGCLLTEIALHNTSQVPYTSTGQRYYTEFHIIGPFDGYYRVGRLDHN